MNIDYVIFRDINEKYQPMWDAEANFFGNWKEFDEVHHDNCITSTKTSRIDVDLLIENPAIVSRWFDIASVAPSVTAVSSELPIVNKYLDEKIGTYLLAFDKLSLCFPCGLKCIDEEHISNLIDKIVLENEEKFVDAGITRGRLKGVLSQLKSTGLRARIKMFLEINAAGKGYADSKDVSRIANDLCVVRHSYVHGDWKGLEKFDSIYLMKLLEVSQRMLSEKVLSIIFSCN